MTTRVAFENAGSAGYRRVFGVARASPAPVLPSADCMLQIARQRVGASAGKLLGAAWRALQVAVPLVVVVVPFAYAVTAVHNDVLLAAGCGLAVGVGLSLRMRERIGRSAGILVGAVAGVAAALLAGLVPGNGVMWIVPPLVALAVGLVDGLGTSRLRGYRDAAVETLAMSTLIGAGLLPALGVGGLLSCLLVTPPTALIAGAFAAGRAERDSARPPLLLALGSLGVLAYAVDGVMHEGLRGGLLRSEALVHAAVAVPAAMVAVPIGAFRAARAAAAWAQPRLQVYGQLAEYLRVMWIPIGGFAIGYLAIIVVFAGFAGMLARFRPGAFAGAENAGIGEWIAFTFFRALAQNYPGIAPVSAAAWLLVGVQAILAVGWALVVFAAVMSSIQPRLERIARQALQSAGK